MYDFTIDLDGVVIRCLGRYPETGRYFAGWHSQTAPVERAVVPEAAWEFWPNTGKPLDAAAEHSLFSMACSDALLSHSRCLFHAVALRCRGRAWLISAPPGVGKSSIFRCLRERHPGEIDIINGDRPLLVLEGQGQVRVCPSPWNGKENWHGASEAPLAGILLLRRGEADGLEPLGPGAAVMGTLNSVICSRLDEALTLRSAAFLDRVLSLVPVWLLTDHSLETCAELLWQELLSKEEGL